MVVRIARHYAKTGRNEMKKENPHEAHYRILIEAVNVLKVEIHHAADVFRFMASWNDEQAMLPEYGEQILGKLRFQIDAIEARAKYLHDLADPSQPEELPF
jgi:hypothetical protein